MRERRARSTVCDNFGGGVRRCSIAALRDLQWRRRRFIIAIIGTGVVFAMTLVLTGLVERLRVEADDTVDDTGVDALDHPVGRGRAVPRLVTVPGDAVAAARQIDGVTERRAASVLGHDA